MWNFSGFVAIRVGSKIAPRSYPRSAPTIRTHASHPRSNHEDYGSTDLDDRGAWIVAHDSWVYGSKVETMDCDRNLIVWLKMMKKMIYNTL